MDDETKDRISAINAEFDQLRAAIRGVAETVCTYYATLSEAGLFDKEELFSLTMEYEIQILQQVLSKPVNLDDE